MRNSIRMDAAVNKARDIRDVIEKGKRDRVYMLLKDGDLSIEDIDRATEVSRTTVSRIKAALEDRVNGHATLKALLDPARNRAGRRSVLSLIEQSKVAAQFIEGGQRVIFVQN